jgi:hypothetical protein
MTRASCGSARSRVLVGSDADFVAVFGDPLPRNYPPIPMPQNARLFFANNVPLQTRLLKLTASRLE